MKRQELLLEVEIEFDNDIGTIIKRQVWIEKVPAFDPTHAKIRARIIEAAPL